MKDANVLIVTEANGRVASGHLFECLVCYEELQKDCNAYLMVNADMPTLFKKKLPERYMEYQSDIQEEAETLAYYVTEYGIAIIVFNLREIKNSFLLRVRELIDTDIICIDEFGHRALNADIIINPMISETYWEYDSGAELYCGAEYLVLNPDITKYHKLDKQINEEIEEITVSMGGVDAPGTTLKLAQWLPEMLENIRINLVIGGGFPYKEELDKIIEHNKQTVVYQNIDFLYDLFFRSDLAVCAGGNTLHELAVIGTPTLVIPSMPHEFQNGQAFQRRGFSICCDMAEQISRQSFELNLRRLYDVEIRSDMKERGKHIADGRGGERVCRIIRNYEIKEEDRGDNWK